MPSAFRLAVTAAASVVLATSAGAQSLRENSLQVSAAMLLSSSSSSEGGGEIQYRLSPRAWSHWSIGGGLQEFYDPTKVCTTPTHCPAFGFTSVLFLEPRYVLPALSNDRSAAYLAGRLAAAVSSNNNGALYGGGGGVLTTLTQTVNLDLGVQAYVQGGSASHVVYQLRAGLAAAF